MVHHTGQAQAWANTDRCRNLQAGSAAAVPAAIWDSPRLRPTGAIRATDRTLCVCAPAQTTKMTTIKYEEYKKHRDDLRHVVRKKRCVRSLGAFLVDAYVSMGITRSEIQN